MSAAQAQEDPLREARTKLEKVITKVTNVRRARRTHAAEEECTRMSAQRRSGCLRSNSTLDAGRAAKMADAPRRVPPAEVAQLH